MSQALIFSDDEDSQRFSKQLQAMNIVGLVPVDYVPSASAARAADKENIAWRANGRTKDENDSGDDYSFTASPAKSVKRPGRLVLRDSADPENEATPLSPHTDVTPALSPFTPKKEEEEEDEWAEQDGQQTPGETRTPRNAGASTRRRRMLRKIKIGMAEQAEAAQRDGIDMDFVFLGEDTPIAPTPFRLRSSGRRSRVSYRNMDWSAEKTDRKSKRRSGPLFDESEEDREVAREWEREREERRKKVERKRKRGEKGTPSTVPGDFTLSDDEPLATIAKRMKVEEGRGRKRRERGKSASTVPESAVMDSDDEPLASIAKRMKKDVKKEVEEDEEDGGRGRKKRDNSASTVLGSEFNSDDEPLASIAKRMKKEVEEELNEMEDRGRRRKKRGESDSAILGSEFNSDDEPLASIAKRMKKEVNEDEGRERRKLRVKKRGQSTTSSTTVPKSSAFTISDDDSDIARELKLEKKRVKRDKSYHGWTPKKGDEDEAGAYPIKRRQR